MLMKQKTKVTYIQNKMFKAVSFQPLKGRHFLSSAVWGEAQFKTTKLPRVVKSPKGPL